jgi:hypothetical protein
MEKGDRMAPATAPRDRQRFGIGEWYGRLFHSLTLTERQAYAALAGLPKSPQTQQPCPFQGDGLSVACTKAGGVCSVRRYVERGDTGLVEVAPGDAGRLRALCPYRFREAGLIYRWTGEVLLGAPDPVVVNEVAFLRSTTDDGESPDAAEEVGRIDQVLIRQSAQSLEWCALEIQAVYFSGASMGRDFAAIRAHTSEALPFPAGHRRPDYRSSGPKRLMPQLQIKVPTLRRWGKKMAVVVDRDFYSALAPMDRVSDISNCDIAWFVVDFTERTDAKAQLTRGDVHPTTLERAVEGLTAGIPVSKDEFERRIVAKLTRRAGGR